MNSCIDNEIDNAYKNRYINRRINLENIKYNRNTFIKKERNINKNEQNSNVESLTNTNDELLLIRNNQEIDTSTFPINFTSLIKIHKIIQLNLKYFNFTEMTPIQRLGIPQILNNNDLVGCAQTGSGKTLAYLIPVLNSLLTNIPPTPKCDYGVSFPIVLIILPTRELALQTYEEVIKMTKDTNIVSEVIFGGEKEFIQKNYIKDGCDILIATPGRLLDFLNQNIISLSEVRHLIIDEADNLLDMGFEPQINSIIFEYDMPFLEDRQTLLFSATFPNGVKRMFNNYIKEDFYFVTNKENLYCDDNTINKNIALKFFYLNQSNFEYKTKSLHKFLQKFRGKTLIFLNTKRNVDELYNTLTYMEYNVTKIHGDITQERRRNAIKLFSSGQVPLLLATDVASRGLDFPNIDFVINFDMPTNIQSFVHRIGRTGRLGRRGYGITFISQSDYNIFPSLVDLLNKNNLEVPQFLF